MLLLMHRGSDFQAQMMADSDKNGCSVAHWAAYKGDLTALKLLHYFKADLQALDSAKMLPLHRAVCASQASVVEFLVEQKSDIQARNQEGKSCLDLAAEKHDLHMQGLLKSLMKKSNDQFGGAKVQPEDLEAGQAKAESSGKGKPGFFKGLMQDKAAHKIFPVFWLVCVSLAVFQYIMDIRVVGYEVAPITAFLFELLVPLSLGFFTFVALGDPGTVPARPQGNSAVEELMKVIDSPAGDIEPPDINRLCTTTWVMKGLRTKYCVQTGACVEEFDHYCVWLNNTIGKANHRQFVGLAIVEFFTQVTHVRLCMVTVMSLIPYQSFTQWMWGAITSYPLLTMIAVIHCVTAPWVLMLTLHQSRLVLMNLTTNEMMNMHRYEHFWTIRQIGPGHSSRIFRNPFNKGSGVANCLDFWWHRTRWQMVAQPQPLEGGCQKQCCNHSH
ncbi:PAT24 [Symbiodinium sp. CCMP2456]|nr:PAT24 [Symbiodinium sp. CCMP2456]